MGQAYSGAYANILSGSLDMDASGWSADLEVSTFDSTTTADAGWESTTTATKKISGSFDIFYNPSKKPTGATAALSPGNSVTLTCYVDKSVDSGDVFSGTALITKHSVKSKVKDGFMVTVSWVGVDAWTYPS